MIVLIPASARAARAAWRALAGPLLAACVIMTAALPVSAAVKPAAKAPAKAAAKATAAKPAPAAKAPAPFTVTIPGSTVKFQMVDVPGGVVEVADPANPGKTKSVTLKPFWIAKTETTWDEYDLFAFGLEPSGNTPAGAADAKSRPSRPYGAPDRGYGHSGYPVISISYYAGQQYCKWLSEQTGKSFRLPTEAEWQHACCAGQPAPSKEQVGEFAWYWEEKTQPVGKKKANAWGLHDMLGNAGEWCASADGKGVLRGGSYEDSASKINCSARAEETPAWNANDPQNPKGRWWLSDGPFAGFRIVCEEQAGTADKGKNQDTRGN